MAAVGTAFARLFLILTALASAGWATSILCSPDNSIALNGTANRIMAGAGFQQNPLVDSESTLAPAEHRAFCSPLEARAIAIIRLRLFEEAVAASDTRLADRRLKSLRSSVDLALGCAPTEGFLWFIRYWSAIHQGEPAGDHFDELRMSYLLSPFEGWIALRRSPYALAIYDILPVDIQAMARNEFVAIVASAFIPEAVNILKGPASTIQDELIPGLAKVRLDFRIQLEKTLHAKGLTLKIPGVETPEFRPWH